MVLLLFSLQQNIGVYWKYKYEIKTIVKYKRRRAYAIMGLGIQFVVIFNTSLENLKILIKLWVPENKPNVYFQKYPLSWWTWY